MEDIDTIQFDQNSLTENAFFGPTNNLYKKKTKEQLIDAIEWMDSDNEASEDSVIQAQHKSNMTRLIDFEDYKEDMINK